MPRACPRCKRSWTKDRQPEWIDGAVEQQWLHKVPEVGVREPESGSYSMCKVCIDRSPLKGGDVEAPYVFLGKGFCLIHAIEAIVLYDKDYAYVKPDAAGDLANSRTRTHDIILQGLDTLELN